MIILGIETSCDDTCVSLIKTTKIKGKFPKFEVISNFVSSQTEVHKKWGGVYPTLAKREHEKNLKPLFEKTLKKRAKSSIKNEPIDSIAVTTGPGLDPCLWTGINFAKKASIFLNIPIVPVNHIEAHLIISFFSPENNFLIPRKNLTFPAIGLIVSGGHTLIVLIKKFGNYRILGETRDDAAGECFDKTARILGLDYPGGPAIARQAEQWKFQIPITNNQTKRIKLPRPMINSKNFDFSFSGLKTAVLYRYESTSNKIKKSKKYKSEMAYEIQQAIADVLIKKTMATAKHYRAKSIILGGGVIANKEIRSRFEKANGEIELFFPPGKLQTDNAIMVAITSFFKKSISLEKIEAIPNLKI